jgi:hypothetical protein
MGLLKLRFENPDNNKTEEDRLLNKTLNVIVNDLFLNTTKEVIKSLMPHHFPYNTFGLTYVMIGSLIGASGYLHDHDAEFLRGATLASSGLVYLALPDKPIENPVAKKITLKFRTITENKLETLDGGIGKEIVKRVDWIARGLDRYVDSVSANPKKIAFDLANVSLLPAGYDAISQCLYNSGSEFFTGLAKLSHVGSALFANYFHSKAQRIEKSSNQIQR